MELIVLGLGGSVGAVLAQLLGLISQRAGREPSAVASAQTTLQAIRALKTKPRAAAFHQRLTGTSSRSAGERSPV